MTPRLHSVRAGRPRDLPRPAWDHHRSRTWHSAYAKDEIAGRVAVGVLGLDGDQQADTEVHGGPDMAVCCYPYAHYARWREEYGAAAKGPGGFGENLTVEGLDEESLCIGDVLRAGTVTLEVASPRGPCANISRWWDQPGMLQRVRDTGRTGWYLRVLAPGALAAGDAVERIAGPHPGWTVRRAFAAWMDPASDRAAVEYFAACPEMSADNRAGYAKRLAALDRPARRA